MLDVYLVGGAVRDKLLGLPVAERDWVVVGSTPQEMLALGFKPVGKDFPVFLHPETHEEYALARTERKTGKGYKGFTFHADPGVTLAEDLKRRDLTINAMAETLDGKIIDPFGGQQDLANKTLRHVSEAFAEDPLRILRVARFAAKLSDFTVHPETLQLMRTIVINQELGALVPERIWQELARALTEQHPERFFALLHDCQALDVLFPEIAAHYPANMQLLQTACVITTNPVIRLAALINMLSPRQVTGFCSHNKVPNHYKVFALLVSKHKNIFPEIMQYDAEQLLIALETLDAFRKPQRLTNFLTCCNAIFPSINAEATKQKIMQAYQAAASISIGAELRKLSGAQIKQQLHEKRMQKIAQCS